MPLFALLVMHISHWIVIFAPGRIAQSGLIFVRYLKCVSKINCLISMYVTWRIVAVLKQGGFYFNSIFRSAFHRDDRLIWKLMPQSYMVAWYIVSMVQLQF